MAYTIKHIIIGSIDYRHRDIFSKVSRDITIENFLFYITVLVFVKLLFHAIYIMYFSNLVYCCSDPFPGEKPPLGDPDRMELDSKDVCSSNNFNTSTPVPTQYPDRMEVDSDSKDVYSSNNSNTNVPSHIQEQEAQL